MKLLTALLIAASEPALPAWMAGCWEQRSGDRWTEECWTSARAGMMMGSSRSGTGNALRDWEVMQIVLDKDVSDDRSVRMAFWGAPRGVNRTLFAWIPSKEPGVTFSNAGHDYPQRIRYWRDGPDLLAEISLLDGSKPVRWRYRRMGN
jgi:hypothetical protein